MRHRTGSGPRTQTQQILSEDTAITHVHGDLHGVKTSDRRALERTFRRRVDPHELVSPELARHLTGIARALGRQVGTLIDRQGSIVHVILGDANQIEIPDLGRFRAGAGRFRGLRLVHTHLRGEPLTRDDLNDLALLRLDLVAVIQAEPDGDAGAIEVAYLAPIEETTSEAPEAAVEDPFHHLTAPSIHQLDLDVTATLEALEAELVRQTRGAAEQRGQERALVVGVSLDDHHFAETVELVRSAGVEVAATIRQKRGRLNPKTVVGSGKISEIVLEGMRQGASVTIFDCDLKPAQAREIEKAIGMRTIDRTQLILDVFAQRAKSADGKLQVELAQLKYQLPRLVGRGDEMSRLAGGIGTRGPGETALEVDRRRIRERVRTLEQRIEKLSKQREVRRSRRRDADLPILSIVGYTNAGKSTLLNALTKSEVEAADRLFMTLDPTSRRLRFPREGEVVITDTVGFIAALPPDLVAAFRATLEELADADLLLHVVDASDPRLEMKIEAVERVLQELDLGNIQRLLVLNKADLIGMAEGRALAKTHHAVLVSASQREGIDALIAAAEERLGTGRALLPEAAHY